MPVASKLRTSDSASSCGSSTSSDAPTTITISPRTSPENRSTKAESEPAATSSCNLVSSRQTTAFRSPATARSSSSVDASRPGASNTTNGNLVATARPSSIFRSSPPRGRNPTMTNGPSIRPDALAAAVSDDAPGIGETAYPAACAARTRSAAGSAIAGVPASVTIATSPSASAARS